MFEEEHDYGFEEEQNDNAFEEQDTPNENDEVMDVDRDRDIVTYTDKEGREYLFNSKAEKREFLRERREERRKKDGIESTIEYINELHQIQDDKERLNNFAEVYISGKIPF